MKKTASLWSNYSLLCSVAVCNIVLLVNRSQPRGITPPMSDIFVQQPANPGMRETQIVPFRKETNHNFPNLKSTLDWNPTEMTIKLIALFKLYKIVFASSEEKMFAIKRVFHNRSRKGIPP